MAEVLGVFDQTVARRYRRLRSAGVIRVVGLRYLKSAGYATWFLRLRCGPASGEAIAAALARRGGTGWVQLLSGDTEVLCSLRGDTTEGGDSRLTRLPRSAAGRRARGDGTDHPHGQAGRPGHGASPPTR